jgi:hypothetical protein
MDVLRTKAELAGPVDPEGETRAREGKIWFQFCGCSVRFYSG